MKRPAEFAPTQRLRDCVRDISFFYWIRDEAADGRSVWRLFRVRRNMGESEVWRGSDVARIRGCLAWVREQKCEIHNLECLPKEVTS